MVCSSFIFILLIKLVYGSEKECDPAGDMCSASNPVAVCKFNIKTPLPVTERHLIKYCSHMQTYYDCVKNHSPAFTADDFTELALVLKHAEPLVQQICEEGNIKREQYLKHGTCLAVVSRSPKVHVNWKIGLAMADLFFKDTINNLEFAGKFSKSCLAGIFFSLKLGDTMKTACPKQKAFYDKVVKQIEFATLYCKSEEEFRNALEAAYQVFPKYVKLDFRDDFYSLKSDIPFRRAVIVEIFRQ